MIKPEYFQPAFLQWVGGVSAKLEKELVNIDGTQSRGSQKKKEKPGEGLRRVRAWANQHRVMLGQVKTQEKSNEITAIPEFLRLLSLKGSLVTSAAMSCQQEIVTQLVVQEADYIISLTGHQGN